MFFQKYQRNADEMPLPESVLALTGKKPIAWAGFKLPDREIIWAGKTGPIPFYHVNITGVKFPYKSRTPSVIHSLVQPYPLRTGNPISLSVNVLYKDLYQTSAGYSISNCVPDGKSDTVSAAYIFNCFPRIETRPSSIISAFPHNGSDW